jgi:peptide/nickel transport system substrate-binding protein
MKHTYLGQHLLKRAAALVLAVVCIASLTSCGSKTKTAEIKQRVPIHLMSTTSYETDVNCIRDMLESVGFDVTVDLYADYATYSTTEVAGDYDVSYMSWGTSSGNGDFAVRGLYHNDGDYNNYPIVDDKLSEMIDKAATLTYEESIPAYTEIENYIVKDKTYCVPCYIQPRNVAINNKVVDEKSIVYGRSTTRKWAATRYLDASNNETRPYVYCQYQVNPPNFDPLRTNVGSTNTINANANIPLVAMDDKDVIITDYSLSQAYAIGEGNNNFYFLLRDDCTYGAIKDGQAYDTGVKVSAQDVVYTYERAMNKDSVPTNRGNSFLKKVKEVSVVTDPETLKSVKISDGSKSVYDYLNSKSSTPITTLTDDAAKVNNASGSYQVVKITTDSAFPQMLNYLTLSTLGIVNKDVVSAANKGIDNTNYDASKNVMYGDISTLTNGSAQFNNNMYFSGPYCITKMDDYGVYMQKNPGYMAGTDFAPTIKNWTVKMIESNSTMLSSLRAGEIDEGTPTESNVEIAKKDANLTVLTWGSNSCYYLGFNLGSSIMKDDNLRKAVLYAIDQDAMIAVKSGQALRAHSTLNMIDTGNEWKADKNKAIEYLNAYTDSKSK